MQIAFLCGHTSTHISSAEGWQQICSCIHPRLLPLPFPPQEFRISHQLVSLGRLPLYKSSHFSSPPFFFFFFFFIISSTLLFIPFPGATSHSISMCNAHRKPIPPSHRAWPAREIHSRGAAARAAMCQAKDGRREGRAWCCRRLSVQRHETGLVRTVPCTDTPGT